MRAGLARLSLVLVATWGVPAAVADEPRLSSQGDVVCGPRCVEYLLQCYRKATPGLIDLVRETQWPDFEAGASLKSLEGALRKRGVFTQAMKVGPEARLCWPYPVLLHLNGDDAFDGHFVVWLPSSTAARDEVWSGLIGVRKSSPAWLAQRRSGAILLTSPVPITDPGAALYDRDWFWQRFARVAAVLLTIVAAGFGGRLILSRLRRGVLGAYSHATTTEGLS